MTGRKLRRLSRRRKRDLSQVGQERFTTASRGRKGRSGVSIISSKRISKSPIRTLGDIGRGGA
jgi:hypothetical protein